MELIRVPQEGTGKELQQKIEKLQRLSVPQKEITLPAGFSPLQQHTSFCLLQSGVLAGYAAVLHSTGTVCGSACSLMVLQQLITLPFFRGHGLGSLLLQAACSEMASQPCDIGLLQCPPSQRSFFERAGWQAQPSRFGAAQDTEPLLLVGQDSPLTMVRLFSRKAQHGRFSFAAETRLAVAKNFSPPSFL